MVVGAADAEVSEASGVAEGGLAVGVDAVGADAEVFPPLSAVVKATSIGVAGSRRMRLGSEQFVRAVLAWRRRSPALG